MSEPPAARPRSRPWGYEEVVLACDLVAKNGWRYLDRRRDHEQARELAELLRRMYPEEAARSDDFRNVNGVSRKTADIATQHPNYVGRPTKGGQYDQPVLLAFVAEPERMHQLADAIRAAVDEPEPTATTPADLDSNETYSEGRTFERRHLTRERDPRARRHKISQARRGTGQVRCEACGFDFEATYGERGHDFIECHHRNPLSVAGSTTTALVDLALLCSNCHRMIHRYRPWLTVEQLAALIQNGDGPASVRPRTTQ